MRRVRKSGVTVVIGLPIFYLLWLVFTGTFSWHELLVGVVAAALSVVGMIVVHLQYPARFAPSIKELLAGWRLPWYLVSGTGEIFLVAGRDLIGGKRAQSLFRVVPFDAGRGNDPRHATRRALATLYTTIAPNFIVVGVNSSDQRLLFHQIERSSVPRMTQSLGAQS